MQGEEFLKVQRRFFTKNFSFNDGNLAIIWGIWYLWYVLLIGGNFLLLVLDAGAEFQIPKIIYSLELEGAFEIQARAKWGL